MLVQCKRCGVHYAQSMGRCVACGAEYEPSAEETRARLVDEAVELLQREPTNRVRGHLVGQGLPELEVDAVLEEARSRVRAKAKQHGSHVAVSGAILLLVALVVFAATGGFLIATGCLAIGGTMFIVGLVKSITGWNFAGPGDE